MFDFEHIGEKNLVVTVRITQIDIGITGIYCLFANELCLVVMLFTRKLLAKFVTILSNFSRYLYPSFPEQSFLV